MPGRLVITGAGGQVGSFLTAEATKQGRELLAFTSSQWNIAEPHLAEQIVQAGDIVVNCAAYTDVDGAETDQATAQAVNADGPARIAQTCAQVGARMVHISTDYVFDGDFGDAAPHPYELDDETRPLSVYGQTKLSGERGVLAALRDAAVVRTAWVYTGGDGKDFVATMRKQAAGDRVIEVVDDQIGSPTYTADLVTALFEVIDGSLQGIVHAANAGEVTRFEQARAVFEGVGADPARVQPVSSDRNPRPAARPAYSALSGRRSAQAGLTQLRPWHDALLAALRR